LILFRFDGRYADARIRDMKINKTNGDY